MILDISARTLSDGERTIQLRRSWVTILKRLAHGHASHDELISALWPDDEPEWAFATIKAQISLLRKAIRVAGMQPVITTIWGTGFGLARPVQVVGESAPSVAIPGYLVPDLRAILYGSRNPAADRLLAVVGA